MQSEMRRDRAALLRQARRLDAVIDEARQALAPPPRDRNAEAATGHLSRFQPENPIVA